MISKLYGPAVVKFSPPAEPLLRRRLLGDRQRRRIVYTSVLGSFAALDRRDGGTETQRARAPWKWRRDCYWILNCGPRAPFGLPAESENYLWPFPRNLSLAWLVRHSVSLRIQPMMRLPRCIIPGMGTREIPRKLGSRYLVPATTLRRVIKCNNARGMSV